MQKQGLSRDLTGLMVFDGSPLLSAVWWEPRTYITKLGGTERNFTVGLPTLSGKNMVVPVPPPPLFGSDGSPDTVPIGALGVCDEIGPLLTRADGEEEGSGDALGVRTGSGEPFTAGGGPIDFEKAFGDALNDIKPDESMGPNSYAVVRTGGAKEKGVTVPPGASGSSRGVGLSPFVPPFADTADLGREPAEEGREALEVAEEGLMDFPVLDALDTRSGT